MIKPHKKPLFPDTKEIFPLPDNRSLCFLKNIVKRPNIDVGDYSYYFDSEDVYNFEKNVLYHYEMLGDKLIIGKFCQIGMGVKFIMNGGNHKYDGFSSFPFHAFPGSCSAIPKSTAFGLIKNDTIVGNDVWIGYGATILPGVKIGNGSIIGACSVVTKDIPPYTIVVGNPSKEIRIRFNKEVVNFLESLKWWDWPIEKIVRHAEHLTAGNIEVLKNLEMGNVKLNKRDKILLRDRQ